MKEENDDDDDDEEKKIIKEKDVTVAVCKAGSSPILHYLTLTTQERKNRRKVRRLFGSFLSDFYQELLTSMWSSSCFRELTTTRHKKTEKSFIFIRHRTSDLFVCVRKKKR